MSDPCKFCDRGGIPLMPVRLAIATSDTPLPVPGAPFVFDSPGLDNGKFKYVLRGLRGGYLYVYDEVRKRWGGYVVTAEGFYYAFDPAGPAPRAETVVFACSRDPVDTALASCITIPHTTALPAGVVYLGFSDVAWTANVLARHQAADYRSRHMTRVDMKAWIGNHAQNFCAELKQADTQVAEYALSAVAGARLFDWSPFEFKKKGITGADGHPMPFFQAVTEAAKQKDARRRAAGQRPIPLLAQHGVVVRLRDPAAVIRETTRLLQHQTLAFMSDPSRARELTLSGAIASIRSAVGDQAVRDEIAAGELNAARAIGDSGGAIVFTKAGQRAIDEMRETTPAEAARARAQSWTKYAAKLKGSQPETFDAKFQSDLATFDAEWALPLSDFHGKWLVDASTTEYFGTNFDSTDISNGFAYQGLVAQCFEHMSDKRPFIEQCQKWLQGAPTDPGNLLLRGLLLNNDEFVKRVLAAANPPFDWRTPGWENVGGWFAQAFAAVDKAAYETWLLGKGPADATSLFFVHVAGPLIRFLAPQLDNPSLAAKTALIAMGITSNAHIVPVDVTGSKKAFRAALIRQLLRSTGQKFNGRQMEKAVADELRRLEVEGTRLEGNTRQRWLMAVDEKSARTIVADMPPGLRPQERANRIVRALSTPEQLEQATSGSALRKVLGMDVRLGVLTAILQCISLSKAMSDENSAMLHETPETKAKLLAAWLALSGTIVETTMVAVSKIPALSLRAAQGLTAARAALSTANVLRWSGRALGAVAGIIVAIMDFTHFLEERRQGNFGLAGLYLASSVAGAALGVGLLFGLITGGWAIFLLVFVVAITIIIELFKDNKLQDWLERTLWGIEGDYYKSSEVEMKQLEAALAG